MNLDVKVGMLQMKLCQVDHALHIILSRLLVPPKPLQQGEVVLHLQVQLDELGEGSLGKARNRVWVRWKLK